MFYLSISPFSLIILGAITSIIFGTIFQNLLGRKLRKSYESPEQEDAFKFKFKRDWLLIIIFDGICLGFWMVLGSGLVILGFGVIPAFGFSFLLIKSTAFFMWSQINKVFLQLQEGGSEALKLD
ncbi:MAG: hypothetical protein AAFQ80_19235 [Cyanobacteria bacterium J06621_8]